MSVLAERHEVIKPHLVCNGDVVDRREEIHGTAHIILRENIAPIQRHDDHEILTPFPREVPEISSLSVTHARAGKRVAGESRDNYDGKLVLRDFCTRTRTLSSQIT